MRLFLIPAALLWATSASAGAPEIVAVKVSGARDSIRFDVTVAHEDAGWDHYADAWQVRAPDGTVLGTRELAHPHVQEQPFTRSLHGVAVPEGLEGVGVFARDSVHGWGEGKTVQLPR